MNIINQSNFHFTFFFISSGPFKVDSYNHGSQRNTTSPTLKWDGADSSQEIQDFHEFMEMRLKDQKVPDIDTYAKIVYLLGQKVFKHEIHLDEMTKMTARILPKYSRSSRPVFKQQIPNGAMQRRPFT